MSGRQFGSGAYARGVATITAVPFTWVVVGSYDSITDTTNTVALLCKSSTAGDNFRVLFDSADGGALRCVAVQSGTGTSAATTNTVAASTPFVAVYRANSSTSREAILNGDLANKGTDTSSKVPAGIDRLSFGRKDDTSASSSFEGVVYYSALWNVALSDAEVLALAKYAPAPLIRPQALQSWWPMFGRSDGSTIRDSLGRVPLTLSGGSDATSAAPRLMPSGAIVGRNTPAAAFKGRVPLRPVRKFQHMLVR